jgi:hypothetical protein
MQSKKKHVLEYFQKDPWPVRMGALAMWLIYLLAVAALISGSIAKSPWLAFLLKRFT